MANKYARIPETIIDLHGYTTREAEEVLHTLIRERKYAHVRIITGKGNRSAHGPVLAQFVRDYLNARQIRYNNAKLHEGGEGALEVFLK
jgi:DNA-nicking Smr family endonuclease